MHRSIPPRPGQLEADQAAEGIASETVSEMASRSSAPTNSGSLRQSGTTSVDTFVTNFVTEKGHTSGSREEMEALVDGVKPSAMEGMSVYNERTDGFDVLADDLRGLEKGPAPHTTNPAPQPTSGPTATAPPSSKVEPVSGEKSAGN